MIVRTSILSVVAVAALSMTANTARADHWERVDDTAVRLSSYMNEVEFEVRAHYRRQPGYAHLLSDAREMAGLADHIHELAHHGANPHHLKSDVDKLDRLFHHFEDLMDAIDRRAHHHHHYRHFAPVHDTRHVRRLLHSTENLLHTLQAEVRYLIPSVHHHHEVHSFGRPIYGNSGPSISFGNGRFRFSIGR